MLLDLRVALRSLARSPGFLLGAVLTLALGLGAVTTAFGLLSGALQQAGGDGAGRTVVVYLTETVNGSPSRMRWPYPAVGLLREHSTSFERLASYTTATLNVTIQSEPARLDVELVSPDYFAITGAAPVLGRGFVAGGEQAPGEPAEAVISHALWQGSYGGAPTVIGQSLRVSRVPLTIVGVMPAGYQGLTGRAAAWVPNTMAPRVSFENYLTSTDYFHNVVATLAAGVSLERAQSELAVIGGRIATEMEPRSEGATDRGALAVPLSEARTNPAAVRARTLVAVGAVLVLLVAGINLANLVAARVGAREREFSVRLAVGASRPQVWRSVASELLIVSIAGVVVALILASWTRDAVAMLIPQGVANPGNDYGQLASFAALQIDFPVLASVGALALLTMVGASLASCRSVFRANLVTTLRRGGDRSSTVASGRAGRLLLASQVAASLCLVASAALVLRSVRALDDVEPGFDPARVIAFSVAEDLAAQQPGAGPLLVERVLDGLAQVPGVQAITAGQCAPFGARCARLGFSVEGRPETEERPLVTGWHRVGPDHFRALGIPIVRGRGFTTDDRRGRQPVVVINQAAVTRFFADADPIGRRIRLPDTLPGDPEVAEIVGIVGDVIYWPPDRAPGPDIYQPALQFSHPWTTVMIRVAPGVWQEPVLWAQPPSQPVLARVRDHLRTIDPNLPMFDVATLSDLGRAGRADRRFVSVLLGACALLALALASVGVYGLTAGWFEQRRKELGVRIALGAEPASLIRLMMASALLHAGAGIVVGIVLTIGAGQMLQALLFGVGPGDPVALGAAAAIMLGVAALASWLPARRALTVDPLRELNAE